MDVTVKSRYLDKEFKVTAHQGPDGSLIISHESLVDIIDNLLPTEKEIRYDFEMIKSDRNHVVVACTVCDTSGRRIKDIGESTPDSLDTKISKNYPCLMAYYRAFDRAVIRYLAFPGKVFSSSEGVPAEQDDATGHSANADQKTETQPTSPQGAPQGRENKGRPTNPGAKNASQNAATPPRNGNASADTTPKEKIPATLPELGAITFSFGMYSGMTIAEIYAKDSDYFAYLNRSNFNLNHGKKIQVQWGLEYARLYEAEVKRNGK